MTDIVTRLRDWRNVHLARLHLLMEEAADEMERLSANGDCPAPENAANEDNTPATHATPSEGIEQSECTLTDEVRRLRGAIAALADQDATLSVCDGTVTVTMDATLTDEEREAVEQAAGRAHQDALHRAAATLRGLLERL